MNLFDETLEKKFLCLCYEHKRVSFNIQIDDIYHECYRRIYKAFLNGVFDLSIEANCDKYKIDVSDFYACLETAEFSFNAFKGYEETLSNLATRRRKIAEYEASIKMMNDPEYEVVSDSIPVSKSKMEMKDEIEEAWRNRTKIELDQFNGLTDKIHTFDPGRVLLLCGTSGTGNRGYI
jgi:hypothetical protein